MHRKRVLGLWLLLCASASSLAAAAKTDSAVTVVPATIPFEEVAKLANLEKDQFESTSTFEKRKCETIAKLLKAGPGDAMVFQFPEGMRRWYDADRQQFVFESTPKAGSTHRPGYYVTILSRVNEKAGYVGQNAFGVSRQIGVREGEYLVLFIQAKHTTTGLEAKLPSKPEAARALAADLRFELVARLGGPCLTFNLTRENPTLDYPFKDVKRVYELHALPGTATWRIVRASTGEVLKTGKP